MNDSSCQTRLCLALGACETTNIEPTRLWLGKLARRLDIASVTLHLPLESRMYTGLKPLIEDLQRNNIAVLAAPAHPVSSSAARSQPQGGEDMQDGENRSRDTNLLDRQLSTIAGLDVDGLHLPPVFATEYNLEQARNIFASQAIVGVDCGTSRHRAMVLGEAGADYVAFSPGSDQSSGSMEELVEWWQQIFTVPCVALDVTRRSQIETLLQIPADFISLGPALLSDLQQNRQLLSWLADKCPARPLPFEVGQS